jgi:hypothetical protein
MKKNNKDTQNHNHSMTNTVHTTILVTGPKNDREELLALVNGETAFDFNKVIPMPLELRLCVRLLSESAIAKAVAEFAKDGHSYRLTRLLSCDEWAKANGIKTERQMFEYLLEIFPEALARGSQLLQNGEPSWQDWADNNWGTISSAYDLQELLHEDEFTIFEFNTYYTDPYPVLEALSKRFRKLTFAVSCKGEYFTEKEFGYELKAGRKISSRSTYIGSFRRRQRERHWKQREGTADNPLCNVIINPKQQIDARGCVRQSAEGFQGLDWCFGPQKGGLR